MSDDNNTAGGPQDPWQGRPPGPPQGGQSYGQQPPGGMPGGPEQQGGQQQPGQQGGPEQHGASQPGQSQPGRMRFQDPSTAAPREPTLAEQRARQQAAVAERERAAQAEQARLAAEQKSDSRRKLLIGSGVGLGLVGLVAGWYLVKPDDVTAVCTDAEGTVVANDDYCDEDYVNSHGGYVSGGFMFLPMPGGGMQQYRYNYGGSGTPGTQVQGGSYNKPSGANISTKSGKSIQRGGFGVSGGSFGKSGA
ncbi:type II secretory pathway pseudopilin PulG [Prauserella sediminis]|uniref:Type II secretory pathway pseudopilin PulG n=2 Tax=Prauserella sediminis TaxID=577680 RepID=A0A839XJ21_9PSEU|nr:type II secretory pathway pseudopilin PulG [Prauserella sediminis]